MRQNETLIHYAGSDRNSRYTVRLYESSVDFTHRDFFIISIRTLSFPTSFRETAYTPCETAPV